MQLAVGRIGRPHGTGGEVTIEVRTDDPGQRFAVGAVIATDPPDRGPLTVASARWHSGGLLVGFAGVTDRDEAERLRGTWLVIDSADVPPPEDPDEFHDAQLIGLAVLTADGSRVGTVADVLHHGQDLLVIRGCAAGAAGDAGGAGEVLVPFVAAIVPEVDVRAGHLVIDPPAGLLDPGGER
jgi:16S rRNA processing protein RimM